MCGRRRHNSHNPYCNALLRRQNPAIGRNGWAPPSTSAPAPPPAPEPPFKAESPVAHDYVYDASEHQQMDPSSHTMTPAQQGHRGEAYWYYHSEPSRNQEHENAARVPLPASPSSSLQDLLKAEENHHVEMRKRFEIQKDFYRPSQSEEQPRQRKRAHFAAQPVQSHYPMKEPTQPQSLFKQTMMAISKYTYM